MGYRKTAILGRFAGQRNQLGDLLRCEFRWAAAALCVTQHLCNQLSQIALICFFGLALRELGSCVVPSSSPAPWSLCIDTQTSADLGVRQAVRGEQDDCCTLNEPLRLFPRTVQSVQNLADSRGHRNCRCLSRHERLHDQRRPTMILAIVNCNPASRRLCRADLWRLSALRDACAYRVLLAYYGLGRRLLRANGFLSTHEFAAPLSNAADCQNRLITVNAIGTSVGQV